MDKLFLTSENEKSWRYVFCRYIVRNGKRIYPKKGRAFRFKVEC